MLAVGVVTTEAVAVAVTAAAVPRGAAASVVVRVVRGAVGVAGATGVSRAAGL